MDSLKERAAQLYMIYSCNMNGTHKSFSECITLAKEGHNVEPISVRPTQRTFKEKKGRSRRNCVS